MLVYSIKCASSLVLFFFLLQTAEASCFLKHQLYRMQSSSLEDIQSFLEAEGWDSESLDSDAENKSGFEFRKSLFTKGYGEKIAVYSAVGYGNIIRMELSADCFQNISLQEFGMVNRKLLVELEKVIQEYQDANQIVQLVEYAGGSETNPEILILSEALKNQVNVVEQLFTGTTASPPMGAGTSSPTAAGTGATDVAYVAVEVQPNPPGGMAGWNKYLSENLRYPENAQENGIEGTVIVAFVVDTDGSITDIEILNGIGGGCDDEAIRIVKGAPKWTPGTQNGVPMRRQMRLPLKFKLAEDTSGKEEEDDQRQRGSEFSGYKVDFGRGNVENPAPSGTIGRGVGQGNAAPNDEESIFLLDELDTPPTPIGGVEAWHRHLSDNLIYPTPARMRGIQGKVLVSFTINTDGTLDAVELVSGIGGGCDEEALRIFKSSPRWSPGILKGKAVRTRMTLPISFKLG